jgi:outer membrane lipoprotein-sorting protein
MTPRRRSSLIPEREILARTAATDRSDRIETMNLLCRKVFLPLCLVFIPTGAWTQSDTETLLSRMKAAYEEVKDYQARLEISSRRRDGSFTTKRVLYTFKKPHWIRLDFESPYRGMVLRYPDHKGKVVVRPSGWARLWKLRLSPNHFFLKVSPGQQIDKTDMGLLIRNISHSLTDLRRGQVDIVEKDEHIEIRVLSDNHFRKGVLTRYQFLIDKTLWLPIEVEESTPDGILERKVMFRSLRLNAGVPESSFQVDRR